MSREIWVDVTLTHLTDPKRLVRVRAFVDNGSTDSAMPAGLLQELGVVPEGAERYEIWGGRTVRRRFGVVRFKMQGRCAPARVTFEPQYEVPTIGATTLEALGFDIDMKNGGLRQFKPRGPHIRRRPHRSLR